MKLLFAEDEYYTRMGLYSSVDWKSLGVDSVLTAEDGQQALELLQTRPEILMTDIRMPFVSGIELAAEARRRDPQCEVIILSSFSDKEYLKAAITLSAVAYLEKPVRIEELKQAVCGAVKRVERSKRLNQLDAREGGRTTGEEINLSKSTRQIRSYIQEHYMDQNLNLETLAGLVHLTPDYLSAEFKEETGQNLKRYITDVRMAEARRLLRESGISMAEIAKKTGYSSNHYFAKTFRREMGCSPSEYRESPETEEVR